MPNPSRLSAGPGWDKTHFMAERKHEPITPDTVRHVAKLSRLAIDEARVKTLADQLEQIVDYVEKVREADTAGVEPMAHPLPLHNVLREDVLEPSLPLDKVLQNAPDTDGPFFKVPKVLGEDEDSAG